MKEGKATLQRGLSLAFLLGWALLGLVEFRKIAPYLYQLETLTSFLGTSLEGKRHRLEGELYEVAKRCEQEIPPSEPLFFYATHTSAERQGSFHTENFFLALDRLKLSYFLYPRPVYWGVESVPQPIRYVLIYHATKSLSGFTHQVDFEKDVYLLKRK